MADLGPAFDTNMLNTPTPRRLMSLWMECAELPVPILPTVMAELTKGPGLHASHEEAETNRLHREAWDDALETANSPFMLLDPTPDASARIRDVLDLLDLKCFPDMVGMGGSEAL